MRIIAIQLDVQWEDKQANFARVESLLAKRRVSPGALIVLPEMFATGFTMNARSMSEPANGEAHRWLSHLSNRHKCTIVAGVACRRGRQCTNEAWVYSAGGRRVMSYAKIHLFRPGREALSYCPGNRLRHFQFGGFTVFPLICYDLRFPELCRLGVRRGAELFVVIANWPAQRQTHWRALLQARAIENQAFVVGVNRCGRDPDLRYAGGSVIFGPCGDVRAEAGSGETAIEAELDPAEARQWRSEFPALADIRTTMRLQPSRRQTGARRLERERREAGVG